ncbi:MAG: hypothetical protein ACREOJ_01050, partial [Gemmatimonadaceae bacterium]
GPTRSLFPESPAMMSFSAISGSQTLVVAAAALPDRLQSGADGDETRGVNGHQDLPVGGQLNSP